MNSKTCNEQTSSDRLSLRFEEEFDLEFGRTEDDKLKFFDALKEVDGSNLNDLIAKMEESSDDLSNTMELLAGLNVQHPGIDGNNILDKENNKAKQHKDEEDVDLEEQHLIGALTIAGEKGVEEDYSFSFESITDIRNQQFPNKEAEMETNSLAYRIEPSKNVKNNHIQAMQGVPDATCETKSETGDSYSISSLRSAKLKPSISYLVGTDCTKSPQVNHSESESLSFSHRTDAKSNIKAGKKEYTSGPKSPFLGQLISSPTSVQKRKDEDSLEKEHLSITSQKSLLKKSVLKKANEKKVARKSQPLKPPLIDEFESLSTSSAMIKSSNVSGSDRAQSTFHNGGGDTDRNVESLWQKIKALESEMAELGSKAILRENEITLQANEIQLKNQELQSKDLEIDSLNRKIELIRSELNDKGLTAVSSAKSTEVLKTLNEQEFLIKGYQIENEKLLNRTKNLQVSIKELEQSHSTSVETMRKEIATMKTQLASKDFPASRTKDLALIQDLKSNLISLKHELEQQKADHQLQVLKYEALLADSKNTMAKLENNFLDIKQSKHILNEEKEKHIEYIVELETKLEWHLKNHDIFATLPLELDSIADAIDSKSLKDIHHVKHPEPLDSQLKSIRSSNSLPEFLHASQSSRPAISLEQTVTFLKKYIQNLENEKFSLKRKSEKEIEALKEKLTVGSSANASFPGATSERKHDDKLENSKKIQNRMKRRILELESLLLAEKSENARLKEELAREIAEKTELISKYENLKSSASHDEELSALKLRLQQALSKNQSLQLQLEVIERSQKLSRESAIELMKSSQQETTRFAFEHSKQSVEFLKSELRQEQLNHHLNSIENYKRQILDLELRLNKQQGGPSEAKLQQELSQLQNDFKELQELHSNCELRLQRAVSNLPPSLTELDRLTKRVHELEGLSKAREALLMRYKNMETNNFDQEKEFMAKELKEKESQIRVFRTKLNDLITSFSSIKACRYG